MLHLPEEFLARMQSLLGTEYDAFIRSYETSRTSGFRINRLKCSPEQFSEITGNSHAPIPWTDNGFFVPEGVRMGASPLYAAGVFYLQEPSAMTPASRLPICPGDRVLDLCAAPGGKATELAARLSGEGLLVANDISNARAKALLRNLELFGASNIFVTNETPGNLSRVFEGFFDKVLVDAPCSGEGMFRKDEAVISTWTPDRPAFFAKLQQDIVGNAIKMLREGGTMMYSTCTFAPRENEGTISWLLENFPEMHLIEMEGYEGFAPGHPEWGNKDPQLAKCVRIWPHRMNGEGHFLALLQKGSEIAVNQGQAPEPDAKSTPRKTDDKIRSSETICMPFKGEEKTYRKKRKNQNKTSSPGIPPQERAALTEFLQMVKHPLPIERLELRGEKVFLSPELPSDVKGLHFLRNGLFLGELKKNRFEPSQPFAMTLSANDFEDCLNLCLNDPRVSRFLSGETLFVESGETKSEKGWKLVCVEGFALGWGKLVNGTLKNKYPAGWRK